MSRKNRSKDLRRTALLQHGGGGEDPGLGRRGLAWLAAALGLACAGYFFLKKTDPAGKNFYAVLSPLFLLAGYLLVPAVLLLFKRPPKPD